MNFKDLEDGAKKIIMSDETTSPITKGILKRLIEVNSHNGMKVAELSIRLEDLEKDLRDQGILKT